MSILECETEVGDLFIQSFKSIRFPLSDSISEEKNVGRLFLLSCESSLTVCIEKPLVLESMHQISTN